MRVFKNRVLRRIFGSKRDELTGNWRPPGRLRDRWYDDIKIDLQEVEWGHVLD